MKEQISHYRIIGPIGAGGMGEVYLAEDTKLSRRVALKVLPSDSSADRKSLNRFLQEARLAANLNHPHICTIFEIDSASDPPFLAMELVEGVNLAERIGSGALTIGETAAIAYQIADALDEAHSASIIHRDIKASNVIINRRGQVKILDFGLAKLIGEEVSDQDVTRAKTEDGMLVGTVQYMSPEHALGKKLDGRTDLWSLGVLLYEMTTGALPFVAATQAGTFDRILNQEPVPPDQLNPEVPPELSSIILKLLEKDRNLRYQTASDLLADLRRLRRQLGEDFNSAEVTGVTGEVAGSRTSFVSGPSRRANNGSLRTIGALLLLGVVAAGAVWVYLRYQAARTAESPAAAGFDSAVASRQTNLGRVVDAIISPDGRYIVYVTDDGVRQTLFLKQMSTGSVVQIVAPSENVYQGIAISPDNDWVYYNIWDRRSVGQIFRVPALGGAPEKVVHDCMPGVSVSPDGRLLTFIRSDEVNRQYLLLTAPTDGKSERVIKTMRETFAYMPAFSPDGSSIAVGIFEGQKERRFPQIVEIPAEGGEFKVVWSNESNTVQPSRFVWLPDRKGFLVTLNNSREFGSQIWQIDYPSGAMRQVTRDSNSYGGLSITSDGSNVLAVQQDFLLSVWVVPVSDPGAARRVTEGKTEGIGVAWTADGRIVYGSNVSGTPQIWIMNADGSEKRQLTSDSVPKLRPCVAGDRIFYSVVGSERGAAAVMGLDGRDPRPIEGVWAVECSAAGRILYLTQVTEGHAGLFQDSAGLSDRKLVNQEGLQDYALSPDGKRVAYVTWDSEKRVNVGEVMSLADGSVRRIELPLSAVQKYAESQYVLGWSPDGRDLTFVNDENGFANVWSLGLESGRARPITRFNDNNVFSFAWSPDGKRLAVSRSTLTSDAVLFRK